MPEHDIMKGRKGVKGMKEKRKTDDFPASAALGIFFFSGLLLLIRTDNIYLNSALFYTCSFIFFGLIICWIAFIQKRFISDRMRTLLVTMASFLLLYILLRTVRYQYVSDNTPRLSRFLWYLYYVPQIFAPLLSFIAAFSVGKADEEKISKRWFFAFFAAAVLSVGILTNDFHELAFRFREGFYNWETDYSYGFLFYTVTVWIYFWLLASIVMLYHKCRISSIRHRVWLPFIWLPVGTFFVVMLALEDITGVRSLFRLPETHCFILAAIWESCIKIGLVPSNIEYNDFFSHSSLDAQIADAGCEVIYRSENAEPLSEKQMLSAIKKPVLIRQHTLLCSHGVLGGNIFWTEDLTAVNTMNEQLREIGEHLAQESDLIKAENEMKEQKARVEEQNRLYDGIAVFVKPYLDRINSLITDESRFHDNLKIAMVLNCYIKRRANLILIGDTKEMLSIQELYFSIKESCGYLKLCGVSCDIGLPSQDFSAPKEEVCFAFDFWQLWIDEGLGSLTAITADISFSDGGLSLKLCADGTHSTVSEEKYRKTLTALGGSVAIDREDETVFICLRFGKGGDTA